MAAEQRYSPRHVRLRLSDVTVATLKDWQHEGYKALRREPTYSQLVEAALARCASMSVIDLLAGGGGFDGEALDETPT
jgi:hypothetical protein